MASYNELNALIDAYINRNGVQAITGQILNGVLKAMVEQLGRGYTIMGAAIPTTDPGTPDGPECYFASTPGTYTDFDGLQIVPGELALLCYTPTDGWTKETIYEGFQEVQATIDGNVGTPSVGVSYADGVLSFDFRNMKGNTGDAAGFGTIGADITGGVGTPGVSVESSGPATAKNLQFHFTNLKGETGVTSVVATVDNTTGTPACTVSLVGQQLTLAFTGLKGAQGNTGVSADYPIAIINNLTTDDPASALSAAQGVVLDGKVSQLEAKVTGNFTEGKILDRTNSESALNTGGYTDFVPYTPGQNVIWRFASANRGYYILFYDANKKFINNSDFTAQYNAQYQGRLLTSSQIAPYAPNARFLRADFDLSYPGASIQVGNDVVWTPDQGLVKDIARLSTKSTLEHKFQQGYIYNTGYVPDPGRCFCRVELKPGLNKLSFVPPTGFEISVIRAEDENGVITDLSTTANELEITKSASYFAIYYIAKLSSNKVIPVYQIDGLLLTQEYSILLDDIGGNIDEKTTPLESEQNNEENERIYNDAAVRSSLREIADSVESLAEGMENTFRAKNTSFESEIITLPHSNGGLFLLNVHRRTNNGFVALNNVYFPGAQKDFSDIAALDGNGNALPLRKIFAGNVDVLPDSRIPSAGLIYADSNGRLYGSSDASTMVYSDDNGLTWQTLQVFGGLGGGKFHFVDSQNNLFAAKGSVLYRSAPPYSSYASVLDFAEILPSATGIVVLPENIIESPTTHRIFIGAYQGAPWNIHILYSDDYGLTWNTAYQATNYQHIHYINIDTHSTPEAIYVGCDGGGGILKSTDNGATWTDLREAHPEIRQATDCGMVYCGDGFRLAGGETSIVGGCSLQKTTDDASFTPVLSCGKGVYMICKLGSSLFGGSISNHPFFTAGIVMADASGENWRTIYTLAPWKHSAASNGFRYLSKVRYSDSEDQIIAGLQGNGSGRNGVRILSGGENYYAQFIVKVPAGVEQIVVESGHFASKVRNFGNDFPIGSTGYLLPLNSGTDVLEIDSALVKKNIHPEEGGRQVGDIYPAIRSVRDMLSSNLIPNIYFSPKNLDLSGGNFHIGMWIRVPESLPAGGSLTIYFIHAGNNGKSIYISNNRNLLYVGSQSFAVAMGPGSWPGVWLRLDINFTADGKCMLYCNGSDNGYIPVTLTDSPLSSFTPNNYSVLYIPELVTSLYTGIEQAVQQFEITLGNITAQDAWNNYYAGLFDVE